VWSSLGLRAFTVSSHNLCVCVFVCVCEYVHDNMGHQSNHTV